MKAKYSSTKPKVATLTGAHWKDGCALHLYQETFNKMQAPQCQKCWMLVQKQLDRRTWGGKLELDPWTSVPFLKCAQLFTFHIRQSLYSLFSENSSCLFLNISMNWCFILPNKESIVINTFLTLCRSWRLSKNDIKPRFPQNDPLRDTSDIMGHKLWGNVKI